MEPGDRRSRPERGPKNPWQLRPVHPIGPMHKSYSGAGRPQGTSRPRGQTPGAAADPRRRHPHWVSPANDETRGGEAGETAGGIEASNDRRRRHPRAKENCEGSENPMSVAGKLETFRPGRENSPSAGPGRVPLKNRTRMTRAGGVSRTPESCKQRRREARKTARANRTGRGSPKPKQRRSGMVRRLASSGRHGATGER